MFGWIKNKATNAKNGASDTAKKLTGFEQIQENAKEIKGMAGVILSPAEQIKNSKKETFTQAMRRMGVNDLQLIQNYKNFAYICYISILFLVLAFLLMIFKLFFKHDIIGCIPVLAVMVLCLANSFKYSFRAFQIKHQKLCAVTDWWNRSSEWLPKI